ncbi:hypothetical protein [Micromonospora pisi]|uniref:hypothetical protein n=1 Tax=Micromonospora pisi TaxID=589240 RepID=UPI0014775AFE|nr:hypothetical protein [Micromonospora pisi]
MDLEEGLWAHERINPGKLNSKRMSDLKAIVLSLTSAPTKVSSARRSRYRGGRDS